MRRAPWRAAAGGVLVVVLVVAPAVQTARFWTAAGRGVFVVERCTSGTVAANGWCEGTVVPGGSTVDLFAAVVYRPDRRPAPGDQLAVRWREDALGSWVTHDRAAHGWGWTLTALNPLLALTGAGTVFWLAATHRTRLAFTVTLGSGAALLAGPTLLLHGFARPL